MSRPERLSALAEELEAVADKLRAGWPQREIALHLGVSLGTINNDVRVITEAMGDGVKRIYEGELAAMKKLRRVPGELVEEADLVAVS